MKLDDVKTIGVMGDGIAQVMALAGFDVAVRDRVWVRSSVERVLSVVCRTI